MIRTGAAGDRLVAHSGAVPAVVTVVRRATFAAAHVLRREDWSEARNREVFGACSGDHGHNYVLEVGVTGEPEPETGMIVNLRDLDALVRSHVIADVDHRHLNRDVPWLEGVVPTAENLALAFWGRLEPALARGELAWLRLTESENNSVEVTRS